MGDIVNFFSGYGAYHHNVVNKWIHILCVPIILYTANGFGEFCQIDYQGTKINWILLINTFAILYYLSLHVVSGLITGLLMYSAHFLFTKEYIAGEENAFWMIFSAHVIGWVAQFIGHGVFEGRKPALMDNLLQVFSAPLFVVLEVLFMIGYNPGLALRCEKAVLAKMPKKSK